VRALPLVIEFFRVVRSRRERGPSSAGWFDSPQSAELPVATV